MVEKTRITPTHEAQRDELADRVKTIVLEDIRKRGPIFRSLKWQLEQEFARFGVSFPGKSEPK